MHWGFLHLLVTLYTTASKLQFTLHAMVILLARSWFVHLNSNSLFHFGPDLANQTFTLVAFFLGHSQILSHSCGEKLSFLHRQNLGVVWGRGFVTSGLASLWQDKLIFPLAFKPSLFKSMFSFHCSLHHKWKQKKVLREDLWEKPQKCMCILVCLSKPERTY